MPGSNQSSNRHGFTLIEILISVAVFVLLTTLIINVYLLAVRAQRQASAHQAVLTSARYVMETIARQVRTSELDYSYSYSNDGDDGISGSETELALLTPDGSRIVYALDDADAHQLNATIDGVAYALTDPAAIEVVNIDFYIEPTADPFKEERCSGLIGCLAGASCTAGGYCACSADTDCGSGYCDPVEDLCVPPNLQPRVTIVLDFKAAAMRPEEQKVIFLQTTVSSRVYQR